MGTGFDCPCAGVGAAGIRTVWSAGEGRRRTRAVGREDERGGRPKERVGEGGESDSKRRKWGVFRLDTEGIGNEQKRLRETEREREKRRMRTREETVTHRGNITHTRTHTKERIEREIQKEMRGCVG